MAIVYGAPMTISCENQLRRMKKEIREVVNGLPAGEYPPKLHACTLIQGAIMVTCANEASKLWLTNRIRELKPWEGAKLDVVDSALRPKHKRAVVGIPDLLVNKCQSRITR